MRKNFIVVELYVIVATCVCTPATFLYALALVPSPMFQKSTLFPSFVTWRIASVEVREELGACTSNADT